MSVAGSKALGTRQDDLRNLAAGAVTEFLIRICVLQNLISQDAIRCRRILAALQNLICLCRTAILQARIWLIKGPITW